MWDLNIYGSKYTSNLNIHKEMRLGSRGGDLGEKLEEDDQNTQISNYRLNKY